MIVKEGSESLWMPELVCTNGPEISAFIFTVQFKFSHVNGSGHNGGEANLNHVFKSCLQYLFCEPFFQTSFYSLLLQVCHLLSFYLFIFNFFNVYVYLRENERDSAWAGEGQREMETESEAGSRLWVVSTEPTWGSNSPAMGSWPQLKSDTPPTEPPRCLCHLFSYCNLYLYHSNHHKSFVLPTLWILYLLLIFSPPKIKSYLPTLSELPSSLYNFCWNYFHYNFLVSTLLWVSGLLWKICFNCI